MFGIVYHPKHSGSVELAAEVCGWLERRGVMAWTEAWTTGLEERNDVGDLRFLVVLGGDGSFLRAARLAADSGVPIFGINMGRVGFLAEAAPGAWQDKLARVLAGDCWVERRLMLCAEWRREGALLERFTALNDVVVGRGAHARVVRLSLYVDDAYVTTYTADGLIVATPTGSTAYSMAAGGPILPPQLKNFLVMPVAAHLSLDRALVLHEEAQIAIRVSLDHEATMTADGQAARTLKYEDEIVVRKYERESRFVRVERSDYFYRSLLERLGLERPEEREPED